MCSRQRRRSRCSTVKIGAYVQDQSRPGERDGRVGYSLAGLRFDWDQIVRESSGCPAVGRGLHAGRHGHDRRFRPHRALLRSHAAEFLAAQRHRYDSYTHDGMAPTGLRRNRVYSQWKACYTTAGIELECRRRAKAASSDLCRHKFLGKQTTNVLCFRNEVEQQRLREITTDERQKITTSSVELDARKLFANGYEYIRTYTHSSRARTRRSTTCQRHRRSGRNKPAVAMGRPQIESFMGWLPVPLRCLEANGILFMRSTSIQDFRTRR